MSHIQGRFCLHSVSRCGHNSISDWIKSNWHNDDIIIRFMEEADIKKGPQHGQATQIIVIRDPYNWFASWLTAARRWKSDVAVESEGPGLISCWKNLVYESIGKSNYLPDGKVVIKYNEWVTDQYARKRAAKELGLDSYSEDHLLVSDAGGGSSFDGIELSGRADEMQVFKRWKQLETDEFYLKCILDEEIEELSRSVFNFKCPLKVENG